MMGIGVVAVLGVGVAGSATLRDEKDVSVATARQAPEPEAPTGENSQDKAMAPITVLWL